ncbi:MAG: precorrin-2 C(20)-methyltransferase [Clostridiales bacterium]|nr:precorrin-2 C(20)-methyltransferase [Clostridiales bacterium]
MSGILYGVGVGPGDSELMTLKAVRLIGEADVIAVPGKDPAATAAYQIAAGAVPEIAMKELVGIFMPMVHDAKEREQYHRQGAEILEALLDEGKTIAFLTLGDVTVYSTFSYIQRIVEADGYLCRLVSGVPSFCAAAAELGISLGLGKEPIHIYPEVQTLTEELSKEGTVVLMKSGSRLREVRESLQKSGRDAVMVENCGMSGEKIYRHADEIPDTAGYFSIILSR